MAKTKTKKQQKEYEALKKEIIGELDPERLKLEKIILLKTIISKGTNASIEAMKELEAMSIEEFGLGNGDDIQVGFEYISGDDGDNEDK